MGFEGAKGGNTPTQNLVDEFDFLDGTPFDWNNPLHVAKMYYDKEGKPTRDPRLYLNVICDGMNYMNQVVGAAGRRQERYAHRRSYHYRLLPEKVDERDGVAEPGDAGDEASSLSGVPLCGDSAELCGSAERMARADLHRPILQDVGIGCLERGAHSSRHAEIYGNG